MATPYFYTPFAPNEALINQGAKAADATMTMAQMERLKQQMAMDAPKLQYADQYAQAGLFGSPFEREKWSQELGMKGEDLKLRREMQERENKKFEQMINHQARGDTVAEQRLKEQIQRDQHNFERQQRLDERKLAHDQATLASGRIPAGYRVTQEGNLEAIPGGPADLKAQQLAQQKATGATDVDIAVQSLRDAYDRLETGKGISNTDKSSLENAVTWTTETNPVAQGIGRMLGTKNQSARNDIEMTRPALLAAIMKATNMSARQMDSNTELKLWIKTATDPTLDIQANRKALDNIEKKYLSGANPATVNSTGRTSEGRIQGLDRTAIENELRRRGVIK